MVENTNRGREVPCGYGSLPRLGPKEEIDWALDGGPIEEEATKRIPRLYYLKSERNWRVAALCLSSIISLAGGILSLDGLRIIGRSYQDAPNQIRVEDVNHGSANPHANIRYCDEHSVSGLIELIGGLYIMGAGLFSTYIGTLKKKDY